MFFGLKLSINMPKMVNIHAQIGDKDVLTVAKVSLDQSASYRNISIL